MRRPAQEVLVGDYGIFDMVAAANGEDITPHPLQKVVEDLVQELLTEEEQDVFYYRFGMRMPHREIARRLGYRSQRSIQIIEQRIIDKIGAELDTA